MEDSENKSNIRGNERKILFLIECGFSEIFFLFSSRFRATRKSDANCLHKSLSVR